jgi:hypothetical protein
MPAHDKSLSYKAVKMNMNAWYIQASLIYRRDVIGILPTKYADTYKSMMELYDNVIENIWPEEPDDNAEFIQLCCFIELLEDMAEQILIAGNMGAQMRQETLYSRQLQSENNILRTEITRLQNTPPAPIKIDGVPMEFSGMDLNSPTIDAESIRVMQQIMQQIQNMQAPPPMQVPQKMNNPFYSGLTGKASAPNTSSPFWQQILPSNPKSRKGSHGKKKP